MSHRRVAGRTDGQMYCMYLKCSPHATTYRFFALALLIDEVSRPVLLVVLASSKALGGRWSGGTTSIAQHSAHSASVSILS